MGARSWPAWRPVASFGGSERIASRWAKRGARQIKYLHAEPPKASWPNLTAVVQPGGRQVDHQREHQERQIIITHLMVSLSSGDSPPSRVIKEFPSGRVVYHIQRSLIVADSTTRARRLSVWLARNFTCCNPACNCCRLVGSRHAKGIHSRLLVGCPCNRLLRRQPK